MTHKQTVGAAVKVQCSKCHKTWTERNNRVAPTFGCKVGFPIHLWK